MSPKKVELVAPAGDMEKLKTALLYGADAVYASTPLFSMRTREIGFTLDTLRDGINYTHNLNKKIYITLNTFPHALEIKAWKAHAKKIIALGPDALIVADPGLLDYLKSVTSIPIHLSTQANTTNQLAAQFWEKQQVKRIVLARELNLKDIKLITKNSKIKFETFVHGAMCMSYSGRCQISNYFIGRDPNKGECIQPCRFKYKVYALEEEMRPQEFFPITETEEGTYIFNSKDLCMIKHIPELIKAGISAFKIEGRMKSSYYVGSVTRVYRQAIDEYFKDAKQYNKNGQKYFYEIQKINNRGFTTGFYFEKPNQNTNNYLTSKEISDYSYIGMVKNYDNKTKILAFEVKNYLPAGSILEILLPNMIVKHKLSKIVYKNKIIKAAHANYMLNIKTEAQIPVGTLIRIKSPKIKS